MLRRNRQNPALATATCAALLAASFAVSPLEAASIESIERYCNSSWRQAGIPQADWEDCTQDTMLELLSRLPQRDVARAIENSSSPERRELMRSIWCVAQRWRRQMQRSPVSLDVMPDYGEDEQVHFVDRLANVEVLERGLEELTETQQSILKLWCDGHSVADIAQELEMSAARVSDQKYKAIRTLKARLVGENSTGN